jgi:hypothetical protein
LSDFPKYRVDGRYTVNPINAGIATNKPPLTIEYLTFGPPKIISRNQILISAVVSNEAIKGLRILLRLNNTHNNISPNRIEIIITYPKAFKCSL